MFNSEKTTHVAAFFLWKNPNFANLDRRSK